RCAGPHRRPEITAEQSAHPVDELTPQRLVEPEARALDVERLLGCERALAGEAQLHDVAGHHAHEKEDEHRDADPRREHQEDAFDDVSGHARWQAALCPGVRSRRSGMSYLQRSMAMGQRGWNTHPAGGLSGLGTSPRSTMP